MDAENLPLASRTHRFVGALIDTTLAVAIMVPIMFMTGVFQQSLESGGMSIGLQVVLFVAGWLVFLALNGYLLFTKGQTIGKVAMKTKIVDLDGNLPNFGKILVLRYLALGAIAQIPILGALASLINALFIFGKERRCLHDYMAGTRVVDA